MKVFNWKKPLSLLAVAALLLLCGGCGQESEINDDLTKANQGDAEAQLKVGVRYHRGEGVPQDYVEAAKWIRKAAEQGLDLAQAMLSSMYALGEGVPQDYAEAAKWTRKAAEQGLAASQRMLGILYSEGQGMPQDEVEGYTWLLLAKANGDEDAGEMISDLEKRLTAEQIEKGRAQVLHRLIGAE